jgi:hypothetical protein
MTEHSKIEGRIFVDEAGDYAAIPHDVPHMTGAEAIAHFTKMMSEKAEK